MLGVLLIDKPLGCTSHDVVDAIRRRVGTRRVGHAGTLDPLATGLLVVAVGPATRFLQYLPLEPKQYVARIRFGQATSTYDAEGEVTSEGPVPDDLLGAFQSVAPRFLGLIQQQPPMFSAVKVDGQPLYKMARKGQEVERAFRTVHIGRMDPVQDVTVLPPALARDLRPDEMLVDVECSGGTYVRSVAHDLGQAMGCGAHLTGLHRTGVGRFRVQDACALDEIAPDQLVGLEVALQPMAMAPIDDRRIEFVRHGRQIRVEGVPDGLVALLDGKGRVFSVARIEDAVAHPECVIPDGVLDALAP